MDTDARGIGFVHSSTVISSISETTGFGWHDEIKRRTVDDGGGGMSKWSVELKFRKFPIFPFMKNESYAKPNFSPKMDNIDLTKKID